MRDKMVRWALALSYLLVGLLLLVTTTTPFADGDVWWQMAYGREILQRRSVEFAHSMFSWTKLDDANVYCAPLGQLSLLAAFRTGGLWGLYLLRYVTIVGCVALAWSLARSRGLAARLETPLLLGLLISSLGPGTFLKPQLFSTGFLCLLAAGYFHFREKNLHRAVWSLPILFWLWLNVHGEALVGMAFCLAVLAGEGLATRLGRDNHLSPRSLMTLCGLLVASGAAYLLTPYGLEYPRSLLRQGDALRGAVTHTAFVSAWQPTFQSNPSLSRLVLWAIYAVLAVLLIRRIRSSQRAFPLQPVVMVNLAFAVLSSLYLRTAHLWPIVAVFSIFALTERDSRRSALEKIAPLGLLLLILVPLYIRLPGERLKLGPGRYSPVLEVEWLKRYGPREAQGLPLYNDYNCGGYLLWALYPQYKTMIDPRGFPFDEWYAEYSEFSQGKNFGEFTRARPADLALITYDEYPLVKAFAASPDWTPAFVGSRAVVFVKGKKGASGDPSFAERRFESVTEAQTLLRAFEMASAARDEDVVRRVIEAAERNFSDLAGGDFVANLKVNQSTLEALGRGDWRAAIGYGEQAEKLGFSFSYAGLTGLYERAARETLATGDLAASQRYSALVAERRARTAPTPQPLPSPPLF